MPERPVQPPTKYIPELPDHLEGYRPLGAEAVSGEERRVWYAFHEGFYTDAEAYVGQFEGRPDPRFQNTAQRLGRKLVGKESAGPELAEWLDTNKQMNLAIIPNQIRHNVRLYSDLAEQTAEGRNVTIKMVQNGLKRLDDDQKQTLNTFVYMHAPTFLLNSLANRPSLRDRPDADAGFDFRSFDHASALAAAPAEKIVNFLQWHNDRIEKINNDPKTQERLGIERREFVGLIQKAVEAGDLPKVVLDRLENIHEIPTYVGDVFDTTMDGIYGYYLARSGKIVLTEDYLPGTHYHELTHALIGTMSGGSFTEAMTEHIRLSLINGDFQNMNPDVRGDGGTYEAERVLLSSVLKSGLVHNLLADAIKGFCANDITSPEYKHFEERLLESYAGIAIRPFIAQEMAKAYTEIDAGVELLGKEEKVYAQNYASQSVRYLGKILKGMSDDDILRPAVRVLRSVPSSDEKEEQEVQILYADLIPRLTALREYAETHRDKVAA